MLANQLRRISVAEVATVKGFQAFLNLRSRENSVKPNPSENYSSKSHAHELRKISNR